MALENKDNSSIIGLDDSHDQREVVRILASNCANACVRIPFNRP